MRSRTSYFLILSALAVACGAAPTEPAPEAPGPEPVLPESPGPAALPGARPSGGAGGPRGTWDGHLVAAGRTRGAELTRYFRVHVPDGYDPAVPAPVVLMLSGFTVDMYGLEAYTELDRSADLHRFLVVYPQPDFRDFGPGIGWVFAWHVYANEWQSKRWLDNPDLDFVRRLLARLGALYNVDRARVFAVGHSRGAALSIMLSFLAPDLVGGFGAQMGFAEVNGFDAFMRGYGGRKMPGFLVHGTDDPDVPVAASDAIAELLRGEGWREGEDLVYLRLPGVTHQWQPQYNEQLWAFLRDRPNTEVGP